MLTSWTDSEFATHVQQLPLVYWTGFDSDSHVWHAELCAKFHRGDAPLLIDFRPDVAKRMTELTILTADDPGLFSRIAGRCGGRCKYCRARITTCHDGTVLDVFFLQDMHNAAIESAEDLEKIRAFWKKPCAGNSDLKRRLMPAGNKPRYVSGSCRPSRVMLSNKISSTHTVIEVNGRDFPGLLHKITACLAARACRSRPRAFQPMVSVLLMCFTSRIFSDCRSIMRADCKIFASVCYRFLTAPTRWPHDGGPVAGPGISANW